MTHFLFAELLEHNRASTGALPGTQRRHAVRRHAIRACVTGRSVFKQHTLHRRQARRHASFGSSGPRPGGPEGRMAPRLAAVKGVLFENAATGDTGANGVPPDGVAALGSGEGAGAGAVMF